jgi:hypothetical protein
MPGFNLRLAAGLIQNPHRLQLGNLGFEIVKKDGSVAGMDDIQDIRSN